jgi:hypothetical protein
MREKQGEFCGSRYVELSLMKYEDYLSFDDR